MRFTAGPEAPRGSGVPWVSRGSLLAPSGARGLGPVGVMDLTALTMCMEHQLPVKVFDFRESGNIRRAIAGESIGTLVTS